MQAPGSTQAGFFLRFLRNTITALVCRAVLVPVFALLAGIATPVLGVPVFPLKASRDGHSLVDQNNVAFRVQGDSAWDLLVTITASDVDTYLANRSAKGFNTLLVELVEHARYAAGSPAPANRAGNRPFLSKLGGGGYTGGGDLADLSTPNDAYFAYVDTILAKIAAKNMVALLTPLYVGYGAPTTQSSANEGWSADMNANSAANCYKYGQYVGDRYRNQKNLIWVNGGDAFGLPAAMASCVQQVMQGIKDGKGSGGSAVLQTTQWSREHLSSDDASYPVPLNSVYPSLATVASLCRSAYGRSPVLPAYVIEACYEGGSCAPTRAQLRQEGYRAALSCIGGYLFGNGPLWLFDSGWQAAMDAPGSLDWQRAGALLDGLGWSSLVPSNLGTLAGTVLVTGGDDIASGGDVAAAASGATLLAYLPSTGTGTRTITVQMGVLGAYARGRWYNPTSGAYTDLTGGAYTLANSGTHAFTTPGNNGTGTNDWVLVLDASTAPTPPVASFTASATTGSAPLALNFTNNSSGTITSDLWTFGDGTTSTAQSPAHIYNSQGVYTVSLQVMGPGGSNTQTRTNYITVTAPADTTPPAAPTNVVATASGSGNIMVTWTAATDNVGVTGYRIERCQGSGCTTFAQIASPAGTSYSDGGLSASTTYRYRVRATDAAGNLSAYSAIATATTGASADTTPPAAPTNVVATASGSSNIMVTWTAATDNVGVTGYRIERCQGAGCTTFAQIAAPGGTSYQRRRLVRQHHVSLPRARDGCSRQPERVFGDRNCDDGRGDGHDAADCADECRGNRQRQQQHHGHLERGDRQRGSHWLSDRALPGRRMHDVRANRGAGRNELQRRRLVRQRHVSLPRARDGCSRQPERVFGDRNCDDGRCAGYDAADRADECRGNRQRERQHHGHLERGDRQRRGHRLSDRALPGHGMLDFRPDRLAIGHNVQ